MPDPQTMPEMLVAPDDVAAQLGICRRQVERLAAMAPDFPRRIKLGKSVRFRQREVDDYIRRLAANAAPAA